MTCVYSCSGTCHHRTSTAEKLELRGSCHSFVQGCNSCPNCAILTQFRIFAPSCAKTPDQPRNFSVPLFLAGNRGRAGNLQLGHHHSIQSDLVAQTRSKHMPGRGGVFGGGRGRIFLLQAAGLLYVHRHSTWAKVSPHFIRIKNVGNILLVYPILVLQNVNGDMVIVLHGVVEFGSILPLLKQ